MSKVQRGADKRIPLPKENEVLVFKDAEIDLYFVEKGKEGPLFFLIKLDTGLLFPIKPSDDFDLVAIVHQEGELLLVEKEKAPNELIKGWIINLSKAISKTSGTEQKKETEEALALVEKGEPYKAAEQFSAQFSDLLTAFVKLEMAKDQAALKTRDSQAEKLFEYSLAQMEQVLGNGWERDKNPLKDPLFSIFQKIGESIHFSFSFPLHFPEQLTQEEKIEHICEFSQIRWRKVELRGEWWKTDMGALLVFVKESPCALLSNKYFLHYELIGLGKKKRMNKELAAQVSTTAYMFYPPFPNSLKKGGEVVKFFLKLTTAQWHLFFLFSILGMLNALFPSMATFFLFKYAIPSNSMSLITYLSLGLLFFSFSIPFFYFLRNYCLLKIEGIGAHAVQTALWDRLLKLSPAFFRKFSIGNLYWRVMAVDDLRISLSGSNIVTLFNGIFSFFYLIMMFFFAPLLALIALLFALAALTLMVGCIILKKKYLEEYTVLKGKIQGLTLQIVLGIAKIRTAGAEKSAFASWAELFAASKSWQMKSQSMQNLVSVIGTSFPILTYAAIYTTIVNSYGVEKLPLASFLAFNISFGNFLSAAYPLGSALSDMVSTLPNWERTRVILEETPEETGQKGHAGTLSGHIRLDNIVFSYHPDSPLVLKGVSIEIRPREFIAFVGKSGSGKSTIARLILGFEKPSSGSVYFDGKDFSKLDPRGVRKQIGSVLQGDRIGGGSLFENLVCGGIYSKEQIRHALQISGFDKDLSSFPMGLNTYIPSGGETLSGGQKQRILLARAFLSSPPILILDEATSALDNQTQQEVSGYIDNLNVTRVVVAQRLSTIRNATRIYVVDNGLIAASGTYDELVAQGGLFADMAARQRL